MTRAYYNEIDPYAAQWLRNLIDAGHIAKGDVDERDVRDIRPSELSGYTQCHFFAGIGVWSYALRLAGWCDDRPVWTGSCPCQPFSAAGAGGGFADERHLWPAFFHLIDQRRPSVIFGEQVASKDGLAWLDVVLDDMEAANYAVWPIDMCAAGVGSPHIRQRLWFVGDSERARLEGHGGYVNGGNQPGRIIPLSCGSVAEAGAAYYRAQTNGFWRDAEWLHCRDLKWRPVEPCTFPLAYGAPSRVGRLRAYGNAIVAQAAEAVIRTYMEETGCGLASEEREQVLGFV